MPRKLPVRCFLHKKDDCAPCDEQRKKHFDSLHHYECRECGVTFVSQDGDARFLEKGSEYHPCTKERRKQYRAARASSIAIPAEAPLSRPSQCMRATVNPNEVADLYGLGEAEKVAVRWFVALLKGEK
jgi:hypothetical protein